MFRGLVGQARRLLLGFLLRAAQPQEQSMDIEQKLIDAAKTAERAVEGAAEAAGEFVLSSAQRVEHFATGAVGVVEEAAVSAVAELGRIHNRIESLSPSVEVTKAKDYVAAAIINLAKHIGA
jgi:hypothetical protein